MLGSYDPRKENKLEQFNVEKIKERISQGAKLSDTVHNFLVARKVISGKKVNSLPKRTPIKKETPADEAPAAAPQAEAAPVA